MPRSTFSGVRHIGFRVRQAGQSTVSLAIVAFRVSARNCVGFRSPLLPCGGERAALDRCCSKNTISRLPSINGCLVRAAFEIQKTARSATSASDSPRPATTRICGLFGRRTGCCPPASRAFSPLRAGCLSFSRKRVFSEPSAAMENPINKASEPSHPRRAEFTERQGQYLAFIHTYTKIHRRPPAEADMQRYFQVTPPTVHQMVVNLDRAQLDRTNPRTTPEHPGSR